MEYLHTHTHNTRAHTHARHNAISPSHTRAQHSTVCAHAWKNGPWHVKPHPTTRSFGSAFKHVLAGVRRGPVHGAYIHEAPCLTACNDYTKHARGLLGQHAAPPLQCTTQCAVVEHKATHGGMGNKATTITTTTTTDTATTITSDTTTATITTATTLLQPSPPLRHCCNDHHHHDTTTITTTTLLQPPLRHYYNHRYNHHGKGMRADLVSCGAPEGPVECHACGDGVGKLGGAVRVRGNLAWKPKRTRKVMPHHTSLRNRTERSCRTTLHFETEQKGYATPHFTSKQNRKVVSHHTSLL